MRRLPISNPPCAFTDIESALRNDCKFVYTLNRWAALTQCLSDGRLPLDTNAVENAIRPIALGRRNWLFARSEARGVCAAQIYSLLGSARLAGLQSLDYLTDVLQRMPTARRRDLEAMLPWNWKPSTIRDIAAEPLRVTTAAYPRSELT